MQLTLIWGLFWVRKTYASGDSDIFLYRIYFWSRPVISSPTIIFLPFRPLPVIEIRVRPSLRIWRSLTFKSHISWARAPVTNIRWRRTASLRPEIVLSLGRSKIIFTSWTVKYALLRGTARFPSTLRVMDAKLPAVAKSWFSAYFANDFMAASLQFLVLTLLFFSVSSQWRNPSITSVDSIEKVIVEADVFKSPFM